VLFYLPTSDAEKEGIKRRLSTLKMKKGEDPRVYFLRFDEALALFRTVDGVLSQTEELAMLRRNLSEDYSQLLTHLLLDSSMNRALFEQRVRTFYIEHDLGNPARQSVVPASLSTAIVATDPHALRFGGGGRAHGGGRGMHARGMHSSDDARPQDRQRPQQRGWGFGPQHQPQHQRPQRFPSLSGQVGTRAADAATWGISHPSAWGRPGFMGGACSAAKMGTSRVFASTTRRPLLSSSSSATSTIGVSRSSRPSSHSNRSSHLPHRTSTLSCPRNSCPRNRTARLCRKTSAFPAVSFSSSSGVS